MRTRNDYERIAQLNDTANRRKIAQLIKDAEAKSTDHDQLDNEHQAAYWSGVAFGLRRALGVLEGRG